MGIPAPAGIAASGLPPPGDQATAVVTGVFTAVGPGQPFAFRGSVNIEIYGGTTTPGAFLVNNVIGGENGATVAGVGDTFRNNLLPPGSTVTAVIQTTPNPIYTYAQPIVTFLGTANLFAPQITISSAAGAMTINNMLGATVGGAGIPAGTTVTGIIQSPIAATGQSPGQAGILALSAQPTSTPGQVQALVPYTFALAQAGLTRNLAADFNGTIIGPNETFTGSVQLEFSYDGGSTWLLAVFPNTVNKAILSTGTPVSISFPQSGAEVLYRLNCTALSAGTINWRMSQTGAVDETIDLPAFG